MYSQPPPQITQPILNQIYLGKCLMKLKFKLVVRRLTGVEAIKKKAPNPLPGSSYTSTWTTGYSSAVEVQQQVFFLPSFISPTRQPNKTTRWPLLSLRAQSHPGQSASTPAQHQLQPFISSCMQAEPCSKGNERISQALLSLLFAESISLCAHRHTGPINQRFLS